MDLNIIILAAGKGSRMHSTIPKVLHKIGDVELLKHVIVTANFLAPKKIIIVYGHLGELVKSTISESLANIKLNDTTQLVWVEQSQQLGTGHAIKLCLDSLDPNCPTVVLYGDVPLIKSNTIVNMLHKHDMRNIVMLTAIIPDPTNYGRIMRNEANKIIKITEEKDLQSQTERDICEINTGFYVLPTTELKNLLTKITNHNQQQEYYLTDIVEIAVAHNIAIENIIIKDHIEIMGVNNKLQLEQLERMYQLRLADNLLLKGLTLFDKTRIDIRGDLIFGLNCVIDVNCIFIGNVELGNNVQIGANCILKNVTIGDNVIINPYTIIDGIAKIANNCKLGPFSRVRPDTVLEENVHIGNFVELKKSTIGTNSKVNHLTYIGDAIVGNNVNIGAGTVTCNYDGQKKSSTVIEDNVFVGSGTMLVAPVTLEEGSVIGAGSTITKNAPKDELTLARTKQVTLNGWLKKNRQK